MISILIVLLAAQGAQPEPTPTPAPLTRLQTRTGSPVAARGTASLADVARRISLRKPDLEEDAVITNETLREFAGGVELTTGSPVGRDREPFDTEERDQREAVMKERWQRRYQEALGRVQQLETQIRRLEGEVARLERSYYAEDDPHYREAAIKPAWDNAMLELRRNRLEMDEIRSLPQDVMNQARRAGALPGWFRGLSPIAPSSAADDAAREEVQRQEEF